MLQPYANNPGFNAMPRPLQAKLIKNTITEVRKQERLATLGRVIQDPQQLAKYYANELTKYGLQSDVGD
jgi:tRNA isopentenyl-2-thiomethyl-A-37 hydroxylase MiaE